jgi:hypothetical protein
MIHTVLLLGSLLVLLAWLRAIEAPKRTEAEAGSHPRT